MKKHNEGYVLAYVMVIIAVLMLVASSVMGVALKNLQRQKAEVETMQARYAAEGTIEKVVSRLDAYGNNEEYALLDTIIGEDVEYQVKSCEGNICVVLIRSVNDRVAVECEIEITSSGGIFNPETEKHGVSKPTWKYVSYKISTVEEMGGGGDV